MQLFAHEGQSLVEHLKGVACLAEGFGRGWTEHFQSTGITGPRHLNRTVRRQFDYHHHAQVCQKPHRKFEAGASAEARQTL